MSPCFIGCTGYNKKESQSPLVGTAWEWVEEPAILVFDDNSSGTFYVKSATDGVYDEIYSSFDFTCEVSGEILTKNFLFKIWFHVRFCNGRWWHADLWSLPF